jgi:hypothetical protein
MYAIMQLLPSSEVNIIQLLTFNEVYSWLYEPDQRLIDRGQLSRLKLKVNNCFIKCINVIFTAPYATLGEYY